jgi:phage tail-like protein
MAEENPVVGFHFALDIQGVIQGYFTSVGGLGSENEVVEQKVVTKKGQQAVMKIPGRLTWEDITLSRGVTTNMDAFAWRQMVIDGKVKDARKNGSITMFDQALTPVVRWNFTNGWPSKLTGGELSSDSGDVVIEELTIVHEGITREAP